MTDEKASRRISIDVPTELYLKLQSHVDHGMRSLIYQRTTEMLVDLFERHGKVAVGYLAAGQFEVRLKKGQDDESP